jgi:uncharacterized protein
MTTHWATRAHAQAHARSGAMALRLTAALAVAAAAASLGPSSALGAAPASGPQVVISQIYGGGGNAGAVLNADYVELRNLQATPVSLAGWSLQYTSAAGTTWSSQLLTLTGNVPANGFFLIKLAGGTTGAALPAADASFTLNMSATAGKLALVRDSNALSGTCPIPASTSVADFVGYGSGTNCSEASAAPAPSATLALLRLDNGCFDSNANGSDFVTGAPNPRNSASAPIACGTVPPPPPPPVATAASIPAIQGSGATSPLVGRLVVTLGVVTLRTNNGFFIQDRFGDGDPATSDGLFVFTGSTAYPDAVAGNLLQVTGTVVEFNTGAASNAETAARPVTELTAVTSVVLQGTGFTITPTPITLPLPVGADLERYEGMLVSISAPLTVVQNFFQGRYGQLSLSAAGRLETPTNRFRPGAQAQELAAANARARIVLDDGNSLQNPNPTPYLGAGGLPRAGDTLVGPLVGVLDYGLATSSNTGAGDYKIHPTVAPTFSASNPRTALPPAVGGNILVASFNVLNFFTTFTDGTTASGGTAQGCSVGASVAASNCRGADNLAEFTRQRAKTVEALAALNADVVGLMEVQNNGSTAAQNLVDALNARVGAGTYATTALPAQGTGTDAIRVAMIYKPARLAPLVAALSDADPVHNRPPLAQPFVLGNGERFTVIVNHFKSKGSCPAANDADFTGNNDTGDGQGCWNAVRRQQGQRLRAWVSQVQTAAGNNDVVLLGDFNAYAQEDPMFDLTSAGWVDQIGRVDPSAYSYVFDAAAGRLDHLFTTTSLSAKVRGATHWHINADETALADYNLEFKAPLNCNGTALCPPDPTTLTPYRSSDHDPVLLGLDLSKTITAPPGSTSVVGTAGDDVLFIGAGRRSITTGAGRDTIVFLAEFAGGATITDFAPGSDLISLRAVLLALGINSPDPIGRGYLTCRGVGADAMILIDPDAAGPALPRPMVLIKNQACGVLQASNFVL